MAKRGRTISNKIGLSETIGDLGDANAVILATWLPLYADDQGRMEASPRRLKAEVCPLLDFITPLDIGLALQRMVQVGYLVLYQHNGTPLLQLVSWWRWNNAMPYTAASEYPAPEGWMDCPSGKDTARRGGYGFRELPRLSEKNEDFPAVVAEVGLPLSTTTATTLLSSGEGESEGEGAAPEEPPTVASDKEAFGRVVHAYEGNFGLVTQFAGEDLQDALLHYPEEWLLDAMREAVRASVRKWSYCRAILERWGREGRVPPDQGAGARASPLEEQSPWSQVGMERKAFEQEYGQEAVEADRLWDKKQAQRNSTARSGSCSPGKNKSAGSGPPPGRGASSRTG